MGTAFSVEFFPLLVYGYGNRVSNIQGEKLVKLTVWLKYRVPAARKPDIASQVSSQVSIESLGNSQPDL